MQALGAETLVVQRDCHRTHDDSPEGKRPATSWHPKLLNKLVADVQDQPTPLTSHISASMASETGLRVDRSEFEPSFGGEQEERAPPGDVGLEAGRVRLPLGGKVRIERSLPGRGERREGRE